MKHVAQLTGKYDFCVLTGTRETYERRAVLSKHLFTEFEYFSSSIDQFKGGISPLIKKQLLKQFPGACLWTEVVQGRVGKLPLKGPHGTLEIIAVYLDPHSKSEQRHQIECIEHAMNSSSH